MGILVDLVKLIFIRSGLLARGKMENGDFVENIQNMNDILLGVIYTCGGNRDWCRISRSTRAGYPGVHGSCAPGYQWHTAGYHMPNSGWPRPPGNADGVPDAAPAKT